MHSDSAAALLILLEAYKYLMQKALMKEILYNMH